MPEHRPAVIHETIQCTMTLAPSKVLLTIPNGQNHLRIQMLALFQSGRAPKTRSPAGNYAINIAELQLFNLRGSRWWWVPPLFVLLMIFLGGPYIGRPWSLDFGSTCWIKLDCVWCGPEILSQIIRILTDIFIFQDLEYPSGCVKIFLSLSFLTFKLSESFWNRFRTIPAV